jgi:4-hydroxy-2-oxoheptanedioate aldolase
MLTIANPARERLVAGQLSVGIGIRYGRTVEIARAMQVAGFDWLFLDLEHGIMTLDTASQIATAAIDAGISPIVRVPHGEFAMATRMFDNGALGMIIPHVDTAAEAQEIAERLRLPPLGHRSLGGSSAALGWGSYSVREASQALNAANLIVVMLETPQAIENADAIAAVDGIDVLLVGTNDLAAEMGIPGEFEHERIADAYRRVIEACKRRGKWPGMGGIYNQPVMQRYVDMGARFLLGGSDIAFVQAGAAARAGFLRGLALK